MAPLSQLTIPRLELLSGLILSRLITTVEEALKPLVAIEKIYCWTDSTTALHWIIGTNKEWKTFVERKSGLAYLPHHGIIVREQKIQPIFRQDRFVTRYIFSSLIPVSSSKF